MKPAAPAGSRRPLPPPSFGCAWCARPGRRSIRSVVVGEEATLIDDFGTGRHRFVIPVAAGADVTDGREHR